MTESQPCDAQNNPYVKLAWFEYHCSESPDSADAEAWHRSHQQVTILSHSPSEDAGVTPDTYRVRWADGFEYDAWADELVESPEDFYRPAPPVHPQKGGDERA